MLGHGGQVEIGMVGMSMLSLGVELVLRFGHLWLAGGGCVPGVESVSV